MSKYTYEEVLGASIEYFNGDDLAAKVFADKYALQNREGKYLEKTPCDMHNRLAKEFARIEAKYPNPMSEEEIFNLLDRYQYIVPQGSPMSAIGNPYQIQSLSNCFVGETTVFTINDGPKAIKDIKIGDIVPTHAGVAKKVVQLHVNPRNGRQLFDIKCFRTPKLTVSGNHKFLSISEEQLKWGEKPSWNEINYLRVGDYIAIPNITSGDSLYEIDILDILKSCDILYKDIPEFDRFYKIAYTENSVSLTTCYKNGKNGAKNGRKVHRPVIRKWKIDKEFAYFIGLWFGDGCVFTVDKQNDILRGITFTFGAKEKNLIDFVAQFGKQTFGIEPDINDNSHIDGSCQIVFHSSALGFIFNKLFGRGSSGKFIPKFMYSMNCEFIEKLILGLIDSDGTLTKEGDVRVVMKNKQIIESIYHMSRKSGMVLGISTTENGIYRLDFPKNTRFVEKIGRSYNDDRIQLAQQRNEATFRTMQINGVQFVKIDEKYKSDRNDDILYTFGVEEHHSYDVEGLICQNCFVVENPYDSYGGICKTDQELAQISKRRGGVGVNISTIRPKGLATANAAKSTDGIAGYMERFSNTIREVGQNGRRGALLIACSVHHPEVRTFINIKKDLKKVTGANISLQLTDEFMNAVKEDREYELRWPVDSKNPKISTYVNAREIWNEIIAAAHGYAEPGLLFWDTALRRTPADIYSDVGFGSICVNPCAELILSKLDSCRLLLLNLISYVNNPFTPDAKFDFELFDAHAQKAQRLMDDMIDLELEAIDRIIDKVNSDPEPMSVKQIELDLWTNIRSACENGRRTGTGITGLGDCLAALGIKYGSEQSIEMTETIYKQLAISCYRSSSIMASERGSFPVFDFSKEKDHEFLSQIWEAAPDVYELYKKHGRRNIALTTTAPTGSVSTQTQTTSGIEPAYLLSYIRRKKINPTDKNATVDFVDHLGDKWQEFTVHHHGIKRWMDITGEVDIEKSPYWGATSNEIDWLASVKLQGAAQKWTCHAISKTCNLPKDTPVDLVKEIYMAAWSYGCKGFTVYRDGCRTGVLVSEKSNEKENKPNNDRPSDINFVFAPKRPEELVCDIKKVKIQGEQWTFFIGMLNDKPYEVFGGLSKYVDIPNKYKEGVIKKNGKVDGLSVYHLYIGKDDDAMVIKDLANIFENANYGAFGRTISLALRHGVPIQYIVEQLGKDKYSDITSFSKVMARVLKSYIKDGTKSSTEKACPSCKKENALIYQDGCVLCSNCGMSKC